MGDAASQYILVAPNAYKGSMSASEAAAAISRGIRDAWPRAAVVSVPFSDGGNGFVDVMDGRLEGDVFSVVVPGPLGDLHASRWYLSQQEGVAAIEQAECVGLHWVKEPSPQTACLSSSYGLGVAMREAERQGAQEIVVGLGGSACVDGGAGMAHALGFRFLTARGRPIRPCGANLTEVTTILSPRGSVIGDRVRVLALYDVVNELCGPAGAAMAYGPQKGADSNAVHLLELGLRNLVRVAERDLGAGLASRLAGSGSGGGCGFGLVAFAGARLMRGSTYVANRLGLDEAMRGSRLVISGEGRLDAQSLDGKATLEVAQCAHRRGLSCWLFPGTSTPAGRLGMEDLGVRVVSVQDSHVMPSKAQAEDRLRRAVRRECMESCLRMG